MNCTICGRLLEQASDALSSNCGGDCWGCVGEIEADQGHQPSLDIVRKEFALGLRPDWTDPSVPVRSVNSTLNNLATLSGQNIAVEGVLTFRSSKATLSQIQEPERFEDLHSKDSGLLGIWLVGRADGAWLTQAAMEGQGKSVTVHGKLRGNLHCPEGSIASQPEMLVYRIQWR